MTPSHVVLVLFLAAFVMSVILHEIAHGWVARACGDPTAEMAGRLTLNPIHHIDPFMTIVLPILMLVMTRGRMVFGGAKPVPVNPYNFRNLEKDDLKVSLAGVAVNLAIAAVFGFSLHLWRPGQLGFTLFGLICGANLVLAFFNLLPIPPLDGSHVARYILAKFDQGLADTYERLGRFGLILLIVLIRFFLPFVFGGVDFVWSKVFMIDSMSFGRLIYNFRASF